MADMTFAMESEPNPINLDDMLATMDELDKTIDRELIAKRYLVVGSSKWMDIRREFRTVTSDGSASCLHGVTLIMLGTVPPDYCELHTWDEVKEMTEDSPPSPANGA